jgi:DNA-binding transcriptional regulator YhcF (GntR family)
MLVLHKDTGAAAMSLLERSQMRRGYTLLWRRIWANPLLVEPGKKFSRLEAWLYIINVLAAGIDDEESGIKRGEFCTSSRYLASKWNWPRTTVQRFFRELESAGMITRINTELGHLAGQSAGHQEGHFIVQNYETYNPARATDRAINWATSRANIKEVIKEGLKEVEKKDTRVPSSDGVRVSPKTLFEIYKQHNQSLPEVKALTSERLKKCRSRIDQAVRDGCLEQYLEDFKAAVMKAQQTPFLRGEGNRGWRASFDWFVANHVNVYAVLEGKYDSPSAGPNNGNGGSHAAAGDYFDCDPGETSTRRTSHGDPIYRPRQ